MFDKLIDFLIQCIQFFQFSHVVNQYEKGIVLRFGSFHRYATPWSAPEPKIAQPPPLPLKRRQLWARLCRWKGEKFPGWVLAIPFFIDSVITVNAVDEPLTIGPQSLTTADGKSVVVSALFVNVVLDPKKFLLKLEGGNAAMLLMAHGVLARFVETRTWEQLTQVVNEEDEEGVEDEAKTEKRAASTSRQLASAMRRRMRKYGVEVGYAQIIEFTQSRSLKIMGVH